MTDAATPVLPPDLPRVLVMMTDRHLGNFVVSLPVLEALLAYFGDNGEGAEVLVDERFVPLARLLPSARRVIAHPAQATKRRGIVSNLAVARLMATLAARRYSAVIDVGGGTRAAALALSTLARRRIGLRWLSGGLAYSTLIRRRGAVHALEQYARVLECVGQDGLPPRLRLHAPPESRDAADAALRAALPEPERPLVVVHPGAGKAYRQWPAERFAAVADALAERAGMNACVIGSPGERALMERVIGGMRRRERACALSLPLDQLLALFERAALVVSNESGPTHLAATTEVPIVTIFGAAKEAEWRPTRPERLTTLRAAECDPRCGRRECVAGLRCLEGTTVEIVLAAAERYLGEAQDKPPGGRTSPA